MLSLSHTDSLRGVSSTLSLLTSSNLYFLRQLLNVLKKVCFQEDWKRWLGLTESAI